MKNYFKNLAYYFPIGKCWAGKNSKETNIGNIIYSLSQQFYRTDTDIYNLFSKFSPYYADEYWLGKWEKFLKIPDDIFFLSDDLEQRRKFVLAKLYMRKIYNLNSYYRLAEILGLKINILMGDTGASILPFRLPIRLMGSSTEIPFSITIEFIGGSSSRLPKTLPFTLKNNLENDEIFKNICDKIKPCDTIIYYRNI